MARASVLARLAAALLGLGCASFTADAQPRPDTRPAFDRLRTQLAAETKRADGAEERLRAALQGNPSCSFAPPQEF